MNGKRASIILGIFMAVVLLGGTLLQLFRGRNTSTQTVVPTVTMAPTFPPPPDAASLDFSPLYFHPTGIFAIGQPESFAQASPSSTANIAQVNMVSNSSQSVIDAFVQNPNRAVTAADLSGFFTQEILDSTWDFFSNWSETNRVASDTDLTIDFSVTLSQQQYVARQRAWTDGTWIYSVRVLTPSNATDYLRALLDGAAGSMIGFTQFAGTPLNWTALYDPASGLIIRTPSNWQLTDGGTGRPTTVTSPDGAALRVETRSSQTVNSADAASALLLELRPNAVIASVEPITKDGSETAVAASGYRITYTSLTPDGETHSGIAEMLYGPDGMLYIALLRVPFAGLERNTAEATPDPSASVDLAQYEMIMDTFGVLVPLNLSPSSLPPTAVPTMTPVPAATTAPEATAEVTQAPEADATAEMTEAPVPEVTAEATAAP